MLWKDNGQRSHCSVTVTFPLHTLNLSKPLASSPGNIRRSKTRGANISQPHHSNFPEDRFAETRLAIFTCPQHSMVQTKHSYLKQGFLSQQLRTRVDRDTHTHTHTSRLRQQFVSRFGLGHSQLVKGFSLCLQPLCSQAFLAALGSAASSKAFQGCRVQTDPRL